MTSALSFQNTSTNASGISFQGISSGIQTSQLVQAEIAQASLPMQQLQARQTANNSRSTALTALQTQMSTLSTDLGTLNSSGFESRVVTSSDPNNTYATATASGGASGSYTLSVQATATSAQISPTLNSAGDPTNMAVASLTNPVYTGASDTFAVEDTNGHTQQITLSKGNNTLQALADAINSSQIADPSKPGSTGLGVQATVVNTGSGATPYELILTSTTTGAGTAGNTIKIADLTGNNNLGIASGSLAASPAVLSPTLDSSGNPTDLAVSTATSPVFTDSTGNNTGTATFALEDTNGNTQQFTLDSSNNTLAGLADAINNLTGVGVKATVGNVGTSANPMLGLTLTSTSSGPGTAGSNITLADLTAGGTVNKLGISAGTLNTAGTAIASGGTVANQPATSTGSAITTGGTTSSAATNAQFTLDGINLTRSSNSVSDAVNGITFNLLQGNQSGTTTLTVAPDTATATSSMEVVISDYNALMSSYNTDAAAGGPLNGDFATQAILKQIQSTLTGAPQGLSASSSLNSASSLGITTNEDGSLSLDTSTFQAALAANATGAQNVFATSATSTNAAVALSIAGPKTTTGVLGFDITSYTSGGAIAGTITVGNTKYNLTGSNGILEGDPGTPLEGLYLNVTGEGSGSLTLSKGVGQATQDLISNLTNEATGTIPDLLTSITNQNTELTSQITAQQDMLNTMQTALENQYSQMESTLSGLQAAQQSISSLS